MPVTSFSAWKVHSWLKFNCSTDSCTISSASSLLIKTANESLVN